MARFRYTAVAPDGQSLEGELFGDNQQAVAADLGQRGLVPLSISTVGKRGDVFGSSINQRKVTAFLGELSLMLRSGLPLDEALELSSRGQSSRLRSVVLALRNEVLGGASFVRTLEKHPGIFSRDVAAMAQVAEATGDLSGVLAAIAAQRDKAERMRDAVVSALRYPAFLIVSAAGVLVFFLLQVIPQFKGLFADSGKDPGLLVDVVLGLSDWLTDNLTGVAVGLTGALLAGMVMARSQAARTQLVSAALRLPIVAGTWRLWRSARFLSTLSLLLSQGVSLTEALRVLDDVVGPYGRSQLLQVGDAVRRGGRLNEALAATELLPPVAVRMIQIGEKTGELARVAGEAGALYSHQLEKRLTTIASFVGPAAIIVIAGLIGGLMVTIMSALVSVDQAVM